MGRRAGSWIRVALVVGTVGAAVTVGPAASAASKPKPVDACALLTGADIQSIFGVAVTQTDKIDDSGSSMCKYEIADNAKEDAFFTVTARWPATTVARASLAKGYAAFKKQANTKVGKYPALYSEEVSLLGAHTGDRTVTVEAQRLCPSPACPSQTRGYLDVQAPLKQAVGKAISRLP